MTAKLTALTASLPTTVPFVGPQQIERERGRPFAARLGANEMGFGPSPRAMRAMVEAAPLVWQYPDPTNHDLVQALAAHHGIAPAHLVVGEGIDGLLGVLVRMLVTQGDAVVTSQGTYPTFNYHVAGFGGTLHQVPYRNDQPDTQGLAAMAHQTKAKLVYLANPDNPMGCLLPADQISVLLDALPQESLLLLDEAYVEFADGALALTPQDPRLIRLRTFSKAYGLAGLRVGYAIGTAELIAAFDRVRNHFGVNAMAQAAALAALQDQAYLGKILDQVTQARAQLADIARENGLSPLPSATNFLTIDTRRDGAFAQAVMTQLAARDVFIRMPFVAPQNRCLRISCGPTTELELLAQALPDALRAAG